MGCAVDGPCATAYRACFESSGCVAYAACFEDCAADAACITDCALSKVAKLEEAKALFEPLFDCAICEQCWIRCPESSLCPP